ncbi:MAG: Maf family protein [Eubacteriales bacterium]
MKLILGSQSPRRRELLARLGLEFDIKVADIDETMDGAIAPKVEVARISKEKALEIGRISPEDALIITADTIVVLDEKVLGKPKSSEDAVSMLTALSGREHQVMTAVTLGKDGQFDTFVETTSVTFRQVLPHEIACYVASGEPLDKAGSYGIQGLGGAFVAGIQGDYYNVMGLPICALSQRLRAHGVAIFQES